VLINAPIIATVSKIDRANRSANRSANHIANRSANDSENGSEHDNENGSAKVGQPEFGPFLSPAGFPS
jgi:hypothetical protein